MKELFNNKKRISLDSAKNLILLDTCFIIDCVCNHKKIEFDNIGITSFNVEEILKIEHKLGHLKKKLRNFIKETDFVIIEIPVSPGDWTEEKHFVNSINLKLLQHVSDASDAVLIATAIKSNSKVLTKDKHHLFTVKLENFLREYNLKVFKELKDVNIS